jgi:hypothetical protein
MKKAARRRLFFLSVMRLVLFECVVEHRFFAAIGIGWIGIIR